MNRRDKVIVAQLLATRDTLLASVAQVDAALIGLGVSPETIGHEPDPADACSHPAEQLRDESTLDTDVYYCRACGETFDHHPHIPKE